MFKLTSIPFAPSSVAGWLSREAMELHHGKHQRAYVDNLNALLPGSGFEKAPLRDIILKGSGSLFENAAQAWNHAFYWLGVGTPHEKDAFKSLPDLRQAIDRSFGSVEAFLKEFKLAGASLFGSGWVWLVQDEKTRKLAILKTPNAGNPLRMGLKPLLTCDVWEHAYYVDYRNDRSAYMDGFLKSVNWAFVDRNLRHSEACSVSDLMHTHGTAPKIPAIQPVTMAG